MGNRIDRLCRSGGAFSVDALRPKGAEYGPAERSALSSALLASLAARQCPAFAEENFSRDIRAKCLFILHEAIDFVDGQ